MFTITSGCGFHGSAPTQIPATLQIATVQPTILALTNTPVPTLLPADAEAKTLELLRNNGGCLLPCFWGFIPHQNDEEFLTFLMETGNEDGSIVVAHDDVFLEIQIALAGDSNAIYTQAYRDSTNGFEKVYDSSYYSEHFQYYSLSNLLATYGPPEQVYIVLDTGIAEMGLGVDLYLLSIEYPSKGWMAVLEMPLRRKENTFFGCPSEAFVNLRIWSPESKPQGAFIGGFGGDDTSYLFTVEEATSMTLEEFYNQFKDSHTLCLETPVDIHK